MSSGISTSLLTSTGTDRDYVQCFEGKICKHSEVEIIKLCLKDGMRTIKEVLATFTNGQIVSFLTKTMKEANEWLEVLGSRD